ncbi:hypothetical protein VNO78_15902 [Psophocarpus tetragonolobus]|uniref:Uncharacterized protein n=1 Tax=Psophocarpus tetragonolobus TaxID=3891 RepID=A0AAN9SHB7_PSOTE
MFKRLMVERDAWAFKNDILDRKAKRNTKCLEDIELKLKKHGYSKTHKFADDMIVLFSYALKYPPTMMFDGVVFSLYSSVFEEAEKIGIDVAYRVITILTYCLV